MPVLLVSMTVMFFVCGSAHLRDLVMGLWFARVDDIGELEGVLDEEHLDRER